MTRWSTFALAGLVAVPMTASVAIGATPPSGHTERVSVGSGGVQGDNSSRLPAVSRDGRFVAFESDASNLVPGDTNAVADVFVRDRRTGTTERVSVRSDGSQVGRRSTIPDISADGRFVAFASDAALVARDVNETTDVYVHDRASGATQIASVRSDGELANGDFRGLFKIAISGNGRFVAFISDATNLVDGDTNGTTDVFVRDRSAGTTERASVGPGGRQSVGFPTLGGLSGDGRYVVFDSGASDLVAGDTNGVEDVFVRDRSAGTTRRMSVATGGGQANNQSFAPAISADGRVVAFWSSASNLVAGDTNDASDLFVRDRRTGTTERVSVTSGGAQTEGGSVERRVGVSADGRFVSFASPAADLVPADTNAAIDVFLRDRLAGTTVRVSVAGTGRQANADSAFSAISRDGRVIAFRSVATNLVAGDTNEVDDVFVRVRRPTCAGRPVTMVGTAGADTLTGTAAGDVILAGAGDDVIRALAGNDAVCGGSGRDVVAGGPGADALAGGPGPDALDGGAGLDACDGGPGTDSAAGCERRVRIP